MASTFDSALSTAEDGLQQAQAAAKASIATRKKLADQTKALKKLATTNDEPWPTVKTTIKSYQEEIDVLTKRCKAAEQGWTTLYQAGLQEASKPPPAPPISNSSNNEDELRRLRQEVADYEVEFKSLKNQDITIRKLETKIQQLEASVDDRVQEQVLKYQNEVEETQGRKTTEAVERQATLERQLQALETELQAERAGLAAYQADWLQRDEGLSQQEAAWEAQRQILVDDAARLREQLQRATRELEEARSSTSIASPPPSTGALSDLVHERQAFEAEVAELAETATLLRDELRQKEETHQDEQRALRLQVEGLEREKSALSRDLATVQAQLSHAPSQQVLDTMKRELRILKRLEYNADEPEVAGEEEKDLEAVLMAKLRKAESDLVSERNQRSDLRQELERLQTALKEAQQDKLEAEKLTASLEKDLEKAIATTPSTTARKTADVTLAPENPAMLQSVLDPDAPVPPPPPPTSDSKTATERQEDDHSVATIVMAQRDRLRARCEALEAERDSFKRELQGQMTAAESLKTDNSKLYEKVRYLQNLKGRGAPRQDQDLDLEALEQRYEASVDPFRQFSKAERQRKLQEMSPIERTVFVVAKTVLGTKEMRTILVIYVVSLHLLVFVTTYHWSHTGSCEMMMHDHLAHLPPVMPKKED